MQVVEEQPTSGGGGALNPGFVHEETRRRVSISSDAVQTDQERQRKISTVYGKGILHNGGATGDKLHYNDYSQSHLSNVPEIVVNLDHLRKYDFHSEESWWYLFCMKCRKKETGPGWEPGFWPSFCPYPFCPTYRHVARCLALVLIVLLCWGIVYSVIGADAAPGGQLFSIAVLVISAHFGGYMFRVLNLPGLVGMLSVGVLYQNIGLIDIHGSYMHFASILRKIALVIILTRAGLDLDPKSMKRLFTTILRIGLVPWLLEASLMIFICYFFLGMPVMWGLLTGVVIAAVSPAVIVPGLMRLRGKGYGVAKGIPTIVIAISGIDDAASVAAFGIVHSLMFSKHSVAYNFLLGPVSILLGIGFGATWGYLCKFVPEKGDPFVVPLRILMLVAGGAVSVFGSEAADLEGAGPLGVVTGAFVAIWLWTNQGWDIEDNPVATAFEIFWMIFEPILFSLTGTQIKINEIDPHVFIIVLLGLIFCSIARWLVTIFVSINASLNMKEKWFIALSCMSKASVQAALAPAALTTVLSLNNLSADDPQRSYAETVLMTCVLSIALTAPTGAILIYILGPRLLSKTMGGPPDHWRHSARPSLRDITVIDEGNEADDIERRVSHSHSMPSTPSRRISPPPQHQ